MISNENVVKEQNIFNENVEILNIFKNIINNYSSNSIFDFEDYEITYVQVKSLLDYITNLQEENRQLCKKLSFKEKCRRKEERSLMKKIDNLSRGNRWLLDESEFQQRKACEYELRVDKAIKNIEENWECNYFTRYDDNVYTLCKETKDILKGE